LTTYFLDNHYFRFQDHNSKQFTVSSAIKWIISVSKPEYFAASSESIGKKYSINPDDISYDLPIHSNITRFRQLDYLENPGRIIRNFYIAAVNEKKANIKINSTRVRRKYTSNTRIPTMKRLKELLQELCEDPTVKHKIFGFLHNIYLDDDRFLSLDNFEDWDMYDDELKVTAHWWSIRDIFQNHLHNVFKLGILTLHPDLTVPILPFKIWMDGTSTGHHSIIKVTASLIFDSTQFLNSLENLSNSELKELSSLYSRIFTWILIPLPETKLAYKEAGKILGNDLKSLLEVIDLPVLSGIKRSVSIRPLLLSSDAKAARIAAGVSGGGIYRCQMCYIQTTQIPDYSIACRMFLRHWRRTSERVSRNEKIPLGDISKPIWMQQLGPSSQKYDATTHATEYLTVLCCIMHVIEGWSAILWKLLLPNLKDKQKLVVDLGKVIVGLIDSKKLLKNSRIPCHCWRDIFSHSLLRDPYVN